MRTHKVWDKMIFDCFIFNNEFSLLSARLNYLQDAVHKFLIVESSYTFTGKRKTFRAKSYLADNFQHLAHKIVVLENDSYLSTKIDDAEIRRVLPYQGSIDEIRKTISDIKVDCEVWLNDSFQRELLAKLIDKYCIEGSTIIISDVDEIPNIKFLHDVGHCDEELIFAQMEQYRYDLHFKDSTPWIGSVACRRSTILNEGVNRIRFFTKRNLTHLRYRVYPAGGWHLTSLGSPVEIKQKISAWGHQELNTPINRLLLRFRIERGLDIFGRSMDIVYIANPCLPAQICSPLAFTHSHAYKSATRWEKACNSLACQIDKAYRKVRTIIHELDSCKR